MPWQSSMETCKWDDLFFVDGIVRELDPDAWRGTSVDRAADAGACS